MGNNYTPSLGCPQDGQASIEEIAKLRRLSPLQGPGNPKASQMSSNSALQFVGVEHTPCETERHICIPEVRPGGGRV
jgi:hypothetical protein